MAERASITLRQGENRASADGRVFMQHSSGNKIVQIVDGGILEGLRAFCISRRIEPAFKPVEKQFQDPAFPIIGDVSYTGEYRVINYLNH